METDTQPYIGLLDGNTDLGFHINVNQSAPLSRCKQIAEIDKSILQTIDYSTAEPAELELICTDVSQSPQVFHRVMTVRIFRLRDPKCILLRMQRRFGVRTEMVDARTYLPIASYARVLNEYYHTVGASTIGMTVLWAPGEHGAVMSWCIGVLLPDSAPIGVAIGNARQQICDIEEIYSSRMIHVDSTSPWESVPQITGGRWFSHWERKQLHKMEGIELIEPLGSGGISTTWVARRKEDGNSVVLKMLAPDLRFTDIDSLRARFSKEVEITRRLIGAHCSPQVLSSGTFMGREYFVMTYHPWPTLRKRAQLGKWSKARRKRVACSLIRAVARMHGSNVIHRDISPNNILVSEDDDVILIDFGAAASAKGSGIADLDLTLPGQQFGSLKYSAPELRDTAQNASKACDVFSTGVIIYEMLLDRNIAGNMRPLAEMGSRVGKELSEFAFHALNFESQARPAARADFPDG